MVNYSKDKLDMSRVYWSLIVKMTLATSTLILYSPSKEPPLSITLGDPIQLCLIRLGSITSCYNSNHSITFLYNGKELVQKHWESSKVLYLKRNNRKRDGVS